MKFTIKDGDNLIVLSQTDVEQMKAFFRNIFQTKCKNLDESEKQFYQYMVVFQNSDNELEWQYGENIEDLIFGDDYYANLVISRTEF